MLRVNATNNLVRVLDFCGRWNAFVSDLAKRVGTLACPLCKAPMKDVVWIAPVQSDPGLIAYECPSCGYVTSVLIDHPPDTSEAAFPDDGRPTGPAISARGGHRKN